MKSARALQPHSHMGKDQFTYDAVPYPSFTFPQTHPDRLSTLGAIAGVSTAHPERCRVLELGCGDGTNLLSFAYALPESQFVGIDLSQVHISRARDTDATMFSSSSMSVMFAMSPEIGRNAPSMQAPPHVCQG